MQALDTNINGVHHNNCIYFILIFKYNCHFDSFYLLHLTLLYSATNRNLPIKTVTNLYTGEEIVYILLLEKLISLPTVLTSLWEG